MKFLMTYAPTSSAPPDPAYSSRVVEVYGPDGKLRWTLELPAAQDGDNYFIHVPAGRYTEGTYAVAIRGMGSNGSGSDLGRSSFDLHVVR